MHAYRRFLLRDSGSRRTLFLLVFAVLLFRALLSGTVMVDPDAPAGSFGLEICSGSGPMFRTPTSIDLSMSMRQGMSMDAMHASGMHVSGMQVSDPPHAAMNDGGDSDTPGICPFSGVFLVAIVALACFLLFLGQVVIGRCRDIAGPVRHRASTHHNRPEARGPPLAA